MLEPDGVSTRPIAPHRRKTSIVARVDVDEVRTTTTSSWRAPDASQAFEHVRDPRAAVELEQRAVSDSPQHSTRAENHWSIGWRTQSEHRRHHGRRDQRAPTEPQNRACSSAKPNSSAEDHEQGAESEHTEMPSLQLAQRHRRPPTCDVSDPADHQARWPVQEARAARSHEPGGDAGADTPHHDGTRGRSRENVGRHARQRDASEHDHQDRRNTRLSGNGDGQRVRQEARAWNRRVPTTARAARCRRTRPPTAETRRNARGTDRSRSTTQRRARAVEGETPRGRASSRSRPAPP